MSQEPVIVEVVERWVDDSFWSFEFEWSDGKVHPYNLRRGGIDVDPRDHQAEAEYLQHIAYDMMRECGE